MNCQNCLGIIHLQLMHWIEFIVREKYIWRVIKLNRVIFLKFQLGWKKFWFVLDGRLLTYYKSKADYESLSACCGCINLGIATSVRPIQIRGCKGYPLQIVTRSQVYYLVRQKF